MAAGRLVPTGSGAELSPAGREFFENLGIDTTDTIWVALTARFLELGWLDSAFELTDTGRHELVETFGLPVDWMVERD